MTQVTEQIEHIQGWNYKPSTGRWLTKSLIYRPLAQSLKQLEYYSNRSGPSEHRQSYTWHHRDCLQTILLLTIRSKQPSLLSLGTSIC